MRDRANCWKCGSAAGPAVFRCGCCGSLAGPTAFSMLTASRRFARSFSPRTTTSNPCLRRATASSKVNSTPHSIAPEGPEARVASWIVGVGTLEALAAAAPPRFSLVATVTDARRGETYSAVFRRSAGNVERLVEDAALTPSQAAQRIAGELGGASSCVLVGDGAERYAEAFARLRDLAVEIIPIREIHPRGSVVASLGERRLRRGDSDRPETLVPLYVRASAAERNLGVGALTTENPVS